MLVSSSLETGIPGYDVMSRDRSRPLLFGVKSDTETMTKVLRRVTEMLTAVPPSQHKFYKTLLQHLHQALQPEIRDDTEEYSAAPHQTTSSYAREKAKRNTITTERARVFTRHLTRSSIKPNHSFITPKIVKECLGPKHSPAASKPAPLSRITSAPTTVQERQHLYQRTRENCVHRHNQDHRHDKLLDEDRECGNKYPSHFNQCSVFSRIEEGVVLMEFGLYNAALERLQHVVHIKDNIVRFLVGKASYKLGKNNSRTDISAWYLEQSVRCLQEVLDSQPSYLAARVYHTKAINRLYVLKHKLVPLLSTKYTKTPILLNDLKKSESKFKKAVAVALEVNRQVLPVRPAENYTNFKLKLVPEKLMKNSIWARTKTAEELLKYQRYIEVLEMVTEILKISTNHCLYFMKSKCLMGIRSHQLVEKIPPLYNLQATNLCDAIASNLTLCCLLSRNCNHKVLFELGRFLGTTNKVIEGVNQLKLALHTKNIQLRQEVYQELIKQLIRYDLTEAAKTLQIYATDLKPKPEQILDFLKRINERFIAKSLRSEAVYWSNTFVSTGIIGAEDIKKLSSNPAVVLQKFRKSSLDASTQGDSVFGLRGSDLLKALTLTEVNKMGGRKRVLSRQISRQMFSADV